MSATTRKRRIWSLTVEQRIERDRIVVLPAGRVGSATARSLLDVLAAAVATGYPHIVVDLTRVDYISSAGLRGLEEIAARQGDAGRDVELRGVGESIRLPLELAGLLPKLAVEQS